MKDNNKNVYSIAVISKITTILFGIITTALINRTLGAELKGEYAYITNWVVIAVSFLSFGIGQTYSTYRRKYGKETLNTFFTLTIIQALIPFVFSIIAYLLNYSYYIYMILLISSTSILRNNISYISAIEDIKKRDINNIVYKLIYTILILVIFLLNIKSLTIMLLLLLVDEMLVFVGNSYKYKFKMDFKFIKGEYRRLFSIYKFGFISMLMTSMSTFNYNLDILFLKKMTTAYDTGLYSVAVTLASMLWLMPDAFRDVIMNKTSKSDSKDEIVFLTKYNLCFAILIIIGYIILGKIFIRIMYGTEFMGSYMSTLILLIGSTFMIIYKLIHQLYIAKGKQALILLILFISVIINVILNLLLIPNYGIIGAAISSVFSYFICAFSILIHFCKEYKVSYIDFVIRKEELKRIIKSLTNIRK